MVEKYSHFSEEVRGEGCFFGGETAFISKNTLVTFLSMKKTHP